MTASLRSTKEEIRKKTEDRVFVYTVPNANGFIELTVSHHGNQY